MSATTGATKGVNPHEADLIRQILAGDTGLFHELIRPYEKMVYVTIYAMLRNEQESEDGAQDTMINAFKHLKSFRGEAKFSTWLVTIAMNEGRRRLRKGKTAAEESIETTLEEHEGDFTPAFLTDWREIPSAAVERKELRAKIQDAVDGLPEKYREVFVLRDLEELNQEETAAALNLKIPTVKVRLHRARIMLQKALVPYLKTEMPKPKGFLGRLFQ